MAVATFRELWRDFGVRWMRKPRTASLLDSLAAQQDLIATWAAGAVALRLVTLCPDDALDPLGRTFGLERAPGESHGSYRAYLRGAWVARKEAGSLSRLRVELRRLWPDAEVITWRALADGGNAGAFGGDAACFYVTASWAVAPIVWDGGEKWDGGALWDLGALTPVQRSTLNAAKRWIASWKPAGKTCRYIELTINGARVVRVPIRERWEYDSNGVATNTYYNAGY